MTDTPPAKTKSRFAAARPKVAAFARFEGTSAWKKYPRRARAYARFRAEAATTQTATAQTATAQGTHAHNPPADLTS